MRGVLTVEICPKHVPLCSSVPPEIAFNIIFSLLYAEKKQGTVTVLYGSISPVSEQRTLSFVDEDDMKAKVFPATYLVCIGMANKWSKNLCSISLSDVNEVEFRRGETFGVQFLKNKSEQKAVISIDDGFMSGFHAKVLKTQSKWQVIDNDSKNGVFVNGEQIEGKNDLDDSDVFEIGNSFWVFRTGVDQHFRQSVSKTLDVFERMHDFKCTFNPELEKSLDELEKVAKADLPLHIHGETGTGKEWIAKFIHDQSEQKGAFVPVNCGAISESLVESELFGHTRGAFSGAVGEKKGYFRSANKGTVFLDEIGELPLKAQSTLLRVLQEKEVTPVGSSSLEKIEFRVIAASHIDLEAAVKSGGFRADLLQRLSGHKFSAFALKNRKEDLGLLIKNICTRIQPSWRGSLTRNAMRKIATYPWPGNIRELEHTLKTAMALCADECIGADDLKNLNVDSLKSEPESTKSTPRKEELLESLKNHHGNVSAVARDFGKARVQIRRWCTKYGIDPETFR